MRPMTDCRFYTLLFVILIKCTLQAQQQKTFKQQFHQPYAQKKLSLYKPAENLTKKNYGAALIESPQNDYKHRIESRRFEEDGKDDNKSEGQSHKEHEQEKLDRILKYSSSLNRDIEMTCAKNCLRNITRKNLPYATNKTTRTTSEKNKKEKENSTHTYDSKETTIVNSNNPLKQEFFSPLAASMTSHLNLQPREGQILHSSSSSIFINSRNAFRDFYKPSQTMPSMSERKVQSFKQVSPSINKEHHLSVHVAHKMHHKEVKTTHREAFKKKQMLNRDKESFKQNFFLRRKRFKRDTTKLCKEQTSVETKNSSERTKPTFSNNNTIAEHDFSHVSFTFAPPQSTTSHYTNYTNSLSQEVSNLLLLEGKSKRSHSMVRVPAEILSKPQESVVIIDDGEEFDSADDRKREFAALNVIGRDERDDHKPEEHPRTMLLRPVLPNPYEDEEMSVVYAEQHSEIRLMCEVDLDIVSTMWYKNGQVVHAMDRTTRVTDYRFIKEANGALTITNVMLEDDGKWQCEAENAQQYLLNARTVKLVVLDRPKPPYLLIDSRRLDAGNIFVPVKENSELNLACISEGGNPRPTLSWEVLLSPGVDRHAQKISVEDMELEEVKNDKDKNAYKINNGAKSEARLRAVYRAHHNARILCVMEHPTLKMRQNASLLLDVQYTPSFAISRTPGFGYPLREGIEVSLKCDVDSNPPSTPRWQKDDGDPPVLQIGDGFLNFTTIRREHSGWYKCTSRHLNFQYSSIGYYLSVRYDSVDVTSEPDDQDMSVAASSHNPNKGQLEVQLGGAVTLQCPQGSLGCWSHLDPITARLKGLGHGSSIPTGQFSLKDVVYQDAGTYKCIGQSPINKKKLEVLQTVAVSVRGAPTAVPRNATPVAYPGSPLHLSVDFCANPSAHAARWLHGDRVYTPGNQYGSTVLAYAVKDLPTPYCKEARLTYVSMHERVPRTFYFIVSSPGGVAEATFKVNFTMRYRTATNVVDEEEEELSEPEEIHFPVFGSSSISRSRCTLLTLLCATILHVFIPSP